MMSKLYEERMGLERNNSYSHDNNSDCDPIKLVQESINEELFLEK